MKVKLDIVISDEYFAKTDRDVDWEENDSTKVSAAQAEALQKILTAECSVHVLRRVTGLCGSLADDMLLIRTKLISDYQALYEPYIAYRDFL